MKIKKVFCLFEQSGTFKGEFKKLGIEAEDYDILNDFGQTDHIKDLFLEIDKAYKKEPSIFDGIGMNDLVMAFFPCTRFEAKIPLAFRGERHGMEKFSEEKKIEYSMKLHEELHAYYMTICKLFSVSLRGGWKMIVENPYTQPHYLTTYFPIRPTIIDKDRTKNGDYYRKPTQFWFINCEPEENLVFEALDYVETHTIARAEKMNGCENRQIKRSLIHPQYARRFIKQFIIDPVERS